jgi:hypothetical protein
MGLRATKKAHNSWPGKNPNPNLTHFSKAMNDSRRKPPSTLELIDIAVISAKHAAHSCRDETAREHFEFAMALLRESWIAESGQEARKPLEVVSDVQRMTDIFAAMAARPLSPNLQ